MAFGVDHSWAACSQKDLAGTWNVYLNGINPDTPSWGRGTVKINSSGKVAPGAKFILFDAKSKVELIFTLTSGQFKINSGCIVTGNINVKLDVVAFKFKVIHSTMDRDKTLIHGIWQGNNKSDTGLVTMIKK